MKTYVFDSYAILAFLENEKGADTGEKALREIMKGKAKGLLSVINWGEIYYIVMREQGSEKVEEVLDFLSHLPLKLVDADQALTRTAAQFKGKYKIAYADCFAAYFSTPTSTRCSFCSNRQ